jgi:Mg2+ and Co2+ transporter CorA
MPQNAFLPIFLDHPSSSELEIAIHSFEKNLSKGKLHITARKGLTGENDLAFSEPFPKIESHDTYLYGVFATPTDIDDGQSKFFNIQLVVNEQIALVVLWGSDDHVAKRAKDLFSRITETANVEQPSGPAPQGDPGDIFVRIARVICEDLQVLITRLNKATAKEMVRIESELFDKEYQSLSNDTTETYQRIRRLKFEILSIAPVINETQNVLKSITGREVLIRPPFTSDDSETAPFSADQRIWINDLLMFTRSLKAQRQGIEQEVRLLYERLESLENRRQTAAQMRFAAVASILLLPALIVGYFGQNFEFTPWSDSPPSWILSGISLTFIAVVQFAYFKKKKWF